MVDQHGAQQEARKLKPVYDALDTGSYKLAIQHCNKLLKKQPNHETVRALKSLALLRGGKGEESIQLCDELLVSKPTDETVLGILSHVLKHLDRTPEITVMFEEAFKKQPHNEELGAQTFMSMIRVGSWKSAQVISLKMFKAFKHTKYLFWSIMSAVLQAQNAGGNSPGHSDHAPMLLTLALKLVASSPVPTFVSPDHLYLHLTILRSLDMIDQAYELIQSDRGKRLCETSLVVEELRKDIFQAKGTCREEASLCFERLDRRGDRNWTTFLSLIDATLKVISLNDPLSDQGSKTTPEPSASSSRSDDPAVNLSTNDNAADPDPELTPKPIPHLELPFEPQAMVDGVRDLFERLARHDGIKERGGHLAVLHLEKKLRARDDTQDGIEPRLLVPLLQTYFSNFGDKACCFEDLKPYIADLKKTAESGAASELDEWHTFLTSQVPQAVSSLDDLQRIINIFKLQRFLLSEPFDAEAEHTRAIEYLKHYFEALPLGKGLADTDLQPADDLAILAVNALVSAWVRSGDQKFIHESIVIAEYALERSKISYQLRVLATRLYRLIGANSAALNHYRLMDIKQVQCDTVSHLILSRGSTFSLAATGDIGMMQECIAASDIYTQNSSDTVDMIVRAFQYEKYSQITEFVEFEDRLDNSLQRDLTRLEYVRMKFTTEKLEPEALILELQELEFVLEKVHHDNRDFSIIPNYQPRGHQLAEQTTMGVVRGFQWLTVFLQLYIRAYARACKVETTAGSDLSTFRMSWLSEMTEDEKAFLEFSQILHEWIPCPPLQSRDAALAAVGAVVIHPENGDAGQERKTSPPPPHVKQDGSEPLKVEASADSAIAFFSRAEERVRSLVSEGTLLWEILHVATLAQEAFILLQIVSLPWVPRSGKGKKPSDHPQIVQSLKSVNSQAAKHLQEISTLLTQFAEAEGSEDKHQVWADGCSALGNVNPALDRDFALNVAKTSLEARCSVSGGIGKGILKILATHQGTPS